MSGVPPETHYAKSGGVNIAYQVAGDGPIDLVYVPGWISHVELAWDLPDLARGFERLMSFSRLILFDKRGTGLSDPVAGPAPLEDRMDDMRAVMDGIRRLQVLPEEEWMTEAKNLGAPYELVCEVARAGKLPVVNFSAGGVATPADAALMMRLGAEGIFVGSGIFKSGDPLKRARAIVRATTHYQDPAMLAEVSRNLGEPMVGINLDTLAQEELMARRGW